jgi:hypothetical protein
MHAGFWWESQKERDHQKDQDVGERIILKCILENRMGWDGLVHLAQDRDQSRALMNTVMNLQDP